MKFTDICMQFTGICAHAVSALTLTAVLQCTFADLAVKPQCDCDRPHAHESAPATTGSTASTMVLFYTGSATA